MRSLASRFESDAVARVRPRVVAVVRAILGRGSPDVDDVVQNALVSFVRALPAFRGECDPAGYASRIAARTALHARRRARASRTDAGGALDDAPANEPSPLESTAAARRTAVVRALLETLPVAQAECVALRFVLGCSIAEVAAATGAPVNTVRSRLRLAKEALKFCIAEDPRLAEELEP
jgi:RNA polymerase sigma-70 factor (ECF subfamily)